TATVDMDIGDDTSAAISRSMGLGLSGLTKALDTLRPDIVLILGDRFEAFAAVIAAVICRIPIAHLHGGESSEGAIDESFRHAITKMAQFHLTAANVFTHRVIQMGEDPARVYTVGAPGLDHIKRTKMLSREQLERDLDCFFSSPLFLATYHPVTTHREEADNECRALMEALDAFPESMIVFTGVNTDAGNHFIAEEIDRFIKANPKRARLFPSLGYQKYLSLLHIADIAIGNSSSGIIEAPACRTISINVGDRQKGRPRAASVLDCDGNPEAIQAAIRTGLSDDFRNSAFLAKHPYGEGGASERIKEILKNIFFDKTIIQKHFYDISWQDK
ncbi:MAG: UDP-N-acetylglucosamine 2-epimerase, partial [Rhodospirillales bacterium]